MSSLSRKDIGNFVRELSDEDKTKERVKEFLEQHDAEEGDIQKILSDLDSYKGWPSNG